MRTRTLVPACRRPIPMWCRRLLWRRVSFGAFVRLRGDEASCGKDPPDRGHRGTNTVASLKVKRDRRCTGLIPIALKLLSQRDDLVFDVLAGAVGAAKRSSWSQARVALGEIALNEGDHPPSRDPVVACNLTLSSPFDQHGRDHQLRHSHRSTLVFGCERCPKTPVNDVVNSGTPSPTMSSSTSSVRRVCHTGVLWAAISTGNAARYVRPEGAPAHRGSLM
jgi:hypothetical protein